MVKGRKDSSTSEATSDGGRLFSLDLPGVCGDDMLVLPNENEVKFYGENKEVCEHDESFISNVYLVLVLIRYQVFMF